MVIDKCCSTCKSTKELADFPKDKRALLGVKSECKICHRERNKRLYYANRERYLSVSNAYKRDNPDVRKVSAHKARAIERNLPYSWTKKDIEKVRSQFDGRCALIGSSEIHYDHFIPLSIGHGGSYVGNMIPLDAQLNESKQAKNPFEWIKTRDEVSADAFNKVVEYLAELNGLTSSEYRSFVYWCFDNKRNIDEIKMDSRQSIDIWRDPTKKEAS